MLCTLQSTVTNCELVRTDQFLSDAFDDRQQGSGSPLSVADESSAARSSEPSFFKYEDSLARFETSKDEKTPQLPAEPLPMALDSQRSEFLALLDPHKRRGVLLCGVQDTAGKVIPGDFDIPKCIPTFYCEFTVSHHGEGSCSVGLSAG